MKKTHVEEDNFGWPEIILSTAAKTIITLNYKFVFTYTPFLIQDYGLSLQQWGVILTMPELMMVICSAITVFLAPYPPHQVNSFFMCLLVLPNVLLPLGIELFPNISIYYWILANRLVFGISYSVINATIGGVIGGFTSESIRGKAVGFVEFSWTLCDYLMPLLGVLLRVAPTSAVWYAQAAFGFLIAIALYIRFPKKAKHYSTIDHSQISELQPLIAKEAKGDRNEPSFLQLLIDRKVIGIVVWGVLSMSYMLMFAYIGVWLQGDFGLNSEQVGLAFFFCFTVAETLSFFYNVLLSDYVGLLRSVYIMTVICTILGLIFGIFSKSLTLIPAILLIGLSNAASEAMYITTFAYATTKKVCINPSLISTILWTSVNAGKAIWVAVGPAMWTAVGEFLDRNKDIHVSQFGATFFLTTVIICVSVIFLEIGQQSSCRKDISCVKPNI